MPSLLSSYELEVRDIGTSAEWTAAYQYEVPVLAAEEEDGRMAVLPRPTPRISADRLQKNIEAALTALGAQQ
ncbi:hypothetical protein FOA52_000274 [Chlamydomonas sp. UWO 241]|nr:hypothetical protein FOA52_000274 [Chlamydomonas sp. UWO 241]